MKNKGERWIMEESGGYWGRGWSRGVDNGEEECIMEERDG